MTAQEYLDELERLRKAAIMPPYYLRKKLFFGEDEEEYYITDKEFMEENVPGLNVIA